MGYSSQTVHADSATTSVIKDQTTTEQVASKTKTSNNDKTDTTSSIVVDTNDANKTEDTTSIVKTKSTKKVDLSNQNSQYNTADWDGSLDQNSHQYTLTKYKSTGNKNIYIPNTQDFINAGTITTDDKVYITKDLLENYQRCRRS